MGRFWAQPVGIAGFVTQLWASASAVRDRRQMCIMMEFHVPDRPELGRIRAGTPSRDRLLHAMPCHAAEGCLKSAKPRMLKR
jgi:hypothetical protein